MFKCIGVVACLGFWFSCSSAYAWQCAPDSPEGTLKNHEVVFVAFLREAHFVEGEGPDDCGRIEGAPEVIEEFKGDAHRVTKVSRKLFNCDRRYASYRIDQFPLGKYILVTTNEEIATIGLCSTEWVHAEPNCLMDDIRRLLGREPLDQEFRDRCIEKERRRNAEREEIIRRFKEQEEEEGPSQSALQ